MRAMFTANLNCLVAVANHSPSGGIYCTFCSSALGIRFGLEG
jgi:hypothetical protein